MARRQRGLVLLAILAVLGAGALYLFLGQLDAQSLRDARGRRTESALVEAKQALIGRAASDDNRPGSLPCPDRVTNIPGNVPGDGIADLLAGSACPSYLGWLPWRTLGVPEPLDGTGESLWYAVSPSMRDDDSAEPINTTTSGDLKLDQVVQIAAIVFSPGPPRSGQGPRPSGNVTDYLDGENADGDAEYASGPGSDSFNDQVLAIPRGELMSRVDKRILAELRGTAAPTGKGLLGHVHDTGVFPWADVTGDGEPDESSISGRMPSSVLTLPTWIDRNGWVPLVTYQVNTSRTAVSIQIDGLSIACTGTACQ
ncbi:MAG: hypothetical protein WBP72_11830 [Rhodocyclaceae bacterium]